MKIDTQQLNTLIYAVSLQTTKVNQLDEAQLPLSEEQIAATHSACVDLIEQLLVIINDLEAQ
jgi:hypothetical protein